MYFLVFDHNVTADKFYVKMCRALDADSNVINAFTYLETALIKDGGAQVRSQDLFVRYPHGALVNRYMLGIRTYGEKTGIDKDLSDLVCTKLAGMSFASDTAPSSWNLDGLVGPDGFNPGPWTRGWGGLLSCWAMNDNYGGGQRSGLVEAPLYSAACSKANINFDGLSDEDKPKLITVLQDTAIEVLRYLVLNYHKAAVKAIMTKYSGNTATISCDNGDECVAKVAGSDIHKTTVTITGKTLCEDCWAKYISYPPTNGERAYNAEHVRLIANGTLDIATIGQRPSNTLHIYTAAWEALRAAGGIVMTREERKAVEDAYNAKLDDLGLGTCKITEQD